MFPAWFITKSRQYGQYAQRFHRRFDEAMENQVDRAIRQIEKQGLPEKEQAALIEQVGDVWDQWYNRFAPPASRNDVMPE